MISHKDPRSLRAFLNDCTYYFPLARSKRSLDDRLESSHFFYFACHCKDLMRVQMATMPLRFFFVCFGRGRVSEFSRAICFVWLRVTEVVRADRREMRTFPLDLFLDFTRFRVDSSGFSSVLLAPIE